MGLLSRVLGRVEARPASRQLLQATLYSGDDPLQAVGESHYQEALWTIVGGHRSEPVHFDTHALLEPEPDNPYDPNAIRVVIAGHLVGYLSRDDAAAYRPGLLQLQKADATGRVALEAAIIGGGPREDGMGRLGVFLRHDRTDFGLAPTHAVTGGELRTGLSEAIATDSDDDSYDLSWRSEISANDLTAIKQLRRLLETEHDPIARHYVFCDLEHRLYRGRNAFASALDEFDQACSAHHSEMPAIRPALLAKFDAVPVIDMYRQATVRYAKARDWKRACEWAQHGIDVYGDAAARPEVVEDLHERLKRANAQLAGGDDARRPRSQTQRVSRPPEVGVQTETLTCASCGETFERARTRGRKPRLCPNCRGGDVEH